MGKQSHDVCRAEHKVLLDCARTSLSAAAAKRLQSAVSRKLDWVFLLGAASSQGVLPLLCYHLTRLCPEVLPAEVLGAMQIRLRANSTRNLFLAAELVKILEMLESNRISAVAFKGPALALSAYGNVALRQFGDLDVLVREESFVTAKNLFFAAGYRLWKDLTPHEEAHHLRWNHALTLVRPQDGVRVDLHWRIAQERYAFEVDLESLWDRAIRVPFCGRDILGLSFEDLLLVLCIHGSKHGWERLGWICDIAELVRAKPELSWEKIMRRSEALQISRAVLLGLDLAKSLLEAPLPEVVLTALRRDRRTKWVSALIRKRLFAHSRRIRPLEKALLFVLTRERLSDKFPHLTHSFLRAVTPNENDTKGVSLPSALHFLYYPWRAMRLTRDAVGRLFSALQ